MSGRVRKVPELGASQSLSCYILFIYAALYLSGAQELISDETSFVLPPPSLPGPHSADWSLLAENAAGKTSRGRKISRLQTAAGISVLIHSSTVHALYNKGFWLESQRTLVFSPLKKPHDLHYDNKYADIWLPCKPASLCHFGEIIRYQRNSIMCYSVLHSKLPL